MSDVMTATSTSTARPMRSAGVTTTARWALSGMWALLDQGLFALANFAVNVVLARWLAADDYGGFTVSYAIFLFLSTVHTALVTEPMLVFGGGPYRERLPDYLRLLMRGHWLLTAGASVALASIAGAMLIAGYRDVGSAVLALAAVNPLLLRLWLVRRTCYVRNKPHLAASGGLVYLAVLVVGAYVLGRAEWLTAPSAFLLMGGGSAAAVAWILSHFKEPFSEDSADFRRGIVSRHWDYGRWAVGTGLLGSVVLNLSYVVMPLRFGLEATAELRALTNLIMPALQSGMALWVVALPRFVSVRDTPAFGAFLRTLLMVCCGGAAANWLLLGLLHSFLVRWLYDGAYADDSHLLWTLGLVPIAFAALAVLENALRSIERSNLVFRAYAAAAATTCVVGIPLTLTWATAGAIAGLLVSISVAVCSMAWSLRNRTRQPGAVS